MICLGKCHGKLLFLLFAMLIILQIVWFDALVLLSMDKNIFFPFSVGVLTGFN